MENDAIEDMPGSENAAAKEAQSAGNNMTAEDGQNAGSEAGASGNLTLNGEAWRGRDRITYTSLLDKYGVSDLFSGESMELYRQMKDEQSARTQALTEYIFSGRMQSENEEEDMAEIIFSEEIRLTRTGDYSRGEEDNSLYFVMAELLFVLIFICVLMRAGAARKKRRRADAVEIDMED